jgi:hypothetical protein
MDVEQNKETIIGSTDNRQLNKITDVHDPDGELKILYPGFSICIESYYKNENIKPKYPIKNEEKDIIVLENLLSDEECKNLIKMANEEGFFEVDGFTEDVRDNSRRRTRDPNMSKLLYNRIEPFIDQKTILIDDCRWDLCRFLDYWRFLKYGPNQKFKLHYDGSKKFFNDKEDRYEMSIYTLNAYLNDGFTSGGTRFFMNCKENAKRFNDEEAGEITHIVNPEKGCALLFNHCNKGYLHDGEPLNVSETVQEKYLMRADLIYRCRKEDIPKLKKKVEEGTCRFWNSEYALKRIVVDYVGNTWQCACCNFNGY